MRGLQRFVNLGSPWGAGASKWTRLGLDLAPKAAAAEWERRLRTR